jgi:S-adenosylmethionine hydrolase
MPILRFPRLLGSLAFFCAMTATLIPAAAAPPIIGLVTDYGEEDAYVAQVKGAIFSLEPNARVLDLVHGIDPFQITEGAYLLDQAAAEFPAGTIFVGVVDPQVGLERSPILLQTGQGKFYVGPDNGLFTLVLDREGFAHAWKLDRPEFFRPGALSNTFHGRDIFAAIAARLAGGTEPDRLGSPLALKNLTLIPVKEPTYAGGTISVQVLHIDHFGNIILNLAQTSEAAGKLKLGDLVKILVGHENYSGPLVSTYGDIGKGRLLLLYGGGGLLEISMNQGSAAHLLKVGPGTVLFLKP